MWIFPIVDLESLLFFVTKVKLSLLILSLFQFRNWISYIAS